MCGLQQYWIGLTTRVSWIFKKAYEGLYGGPKKSAPPQKKLCEPVADNGSDACNVRFF